VLATIDAAVVPTDSAATQFVCAAFAQAGSSTNAPVGFVVIVDESVVVVVVETVPAQASEAVNVLQSVV
jgi:hypothetical protein